MLRSAIKIRSDSQPPTFIIVLSAQGFVPSGKAKHTETFCDP